MVTKYFSKENREARKRSKTNKKIRKRADKEPALKRVSGGRSDAAAKRRKENEAAKKRRAAGIKSNVKSAPKTGSKRYGVGSSKTINGQANVSADQLKRAGLSTGPQGLRKYMNAWNKTGKRPTKATFSNDKPLSKQEVKSAVEKTKAGRRFPKTDRPLTSNEIKKALAETRKNRRFQQEKRKKLSDSKVASAKKTLRDKKLSELKKKQIESAKKNNKRRGPKPASQTYSGAMMPRKENMPSGYLGKFIASRRRPKR